MDTTDKLLTIPAVADQLGYSAATLKSWRWRDTWPAELRLIDVSVGEVPAWRVRQSDVDAYVAARTPEAVA